MSKFNPVARHKARRFALQALYQWQVAKTLPHELEIQFLTDYDFSKTDLDYFKQLIHNIIRLGERLDQVFIPYLNRKFEEVTPVELSILRIGTYELTECLETPYRVVLNESIRLAKTYASEESYKFVNAVLDGVTKKFRTAEMGLPNVE